MAELTEHGQAALAAIRDRHGVSDQTLRALAEAIVMGGGTQAQFDIAELGGMGQWSRGGMVMVGDMFNTGLQARVAALCDEIAQAGAAGPLFRPAQTYQGSYQQQSGGGSQSQSQSGPGQAMGQSLGQGMAMGRQSMSMGGGWWPSELGQPSAQGRQNDLAYAVFPQKQRLAVMLAGRITLYDTGHHEIGGISQDNGGWRFSSQYGTVDLAGLPVVAGDDPEAPETRIKPQAEPDRDRRPTTVTAEPERLIEPQSGEPGVIPAGAGPVAEAARGLAQTSGDIFDALERLGKLKEIGVLTEAEFSDKKAQLLARL